MTNTEAVAKELEAATQAVLDAARAEMQRVEQVAAVGSRVVAAMRGTSHMSRDVMLAEAIELRRLSRASLIAEVTDADSWTRFLAGMQAAADLAVELTSTPREGE